MFVWTEFSQLLLLIEQHNLHFSTISELITVSDRQWWLLQVWVWWLWHWAQRWGHWWCQREWKLPEQGMSEDCLLLYSDWHQSCVWFDPNDLEWINLCFLSNYLPAHIKSMFKEIFLFPNPAVFCDPETASDLCQVSTTSSISDPGPRKITYPWVHFTFTFIPLSKMSKSLHYIKNRK